MLLQVNRALKSIFKPAKKVWGKMTTLHAIKKYFLSVNNGILFRKIGFNVAQRKLQVMNVKRI